MSHDFVKDMMTWGGSSLPLFSCHRGLGGHKSSMASYKTGRVFHMSVESVSTVLTQSYLGGSFVTANSLADQYSHL